MSQRDVHAGEALKRREVDEAIAEHLRLRGAAPDLVEFAERHVVRYSQADLERAQRRAAGITVIFMGIVSLVFSALPR